MQKRITITFDFKRINKTFTADISMKKDDYFIAEVNELPGCHTQAKDMGELLKRTEEAIRAYLKEPKLKPEYIKKLKKIQKQKKIHIGTMKDFRKKLDMD